MINITLRQLRYFEALARHEHFGRAADASGVSQPALSVQIKDLEETLGSPLFERTVRRVRLTAFGEQFAQRVHGILRSVDELGDLARAAQDRFVGRLRLGVIPTIAPYLLPTVIRDLAGAFGDLNIEVRETMTHRLIEELTDGRIDTAIVALPISEPALTEVALFDERLMLVRSDAERGQAVPTRDALRHARLLLLEEGHCFRDQALSFCNLRGGSAGTGLDGSSLSTLVQMVGAGLGVTLVPEMAVAVEIRSAEVCVAPLPDPQPVRTIGMIWRKSNPLADQLGQVADIVRAAGMSIRDTAN